MWIVMRILLVCVCAVLSVSAFASDIRTVLKIDGRTFSVQEIADFYSRTKCVQQDISFSEFLDMFILQQLYITDARANGEDTTAGFRNECSRYRDRLFRKRVMSKKAGNEAYFTDYLQRQPVKLRVAHILCSVVPQASAGEKQLAKRRADDLYRRLQQGEPFEQLATEASDDSFSASNGGLLPAFCRDECDKTFGAAAFALEQDGSISAPVLTPYGWHIIKRIGVEYPVDTLYVRNQFGRWKERFSPENEIPDVRLTAEDSLAVARLSEEFSCNVLIIKSQKKYRLPADAEQLSDYFKRNKKKYRLKQPLFKGYVVECNDKKLSKTLRKLLKKKIAIDSCEQIKEYNSVENTVLKIEKGVYLPGQNQTVDKRAFKRRDRVADSVHEASFVYGKVLKNKPETYLDVRDSVIADWEIWQNAEIKKLLAQKYPVEIDEDVLKTVNFDELIVF